MCKLYYVLTMIFEEIILRRLIKRYKIIRNFFQIYISMIFVLLIISFNFSFFLKIKILFLLRDFKLFS